MLLIVGSSLRLKLWWETKEDEKTTYSASTVLDVEQAPLITRLWRWCVDEFSFKSHRHPGYPFSMTIYVNGTADCRVSACCEYRHQAMVRLGSRGGHFGLVHVSGGAPCFKWVLGGDFTHSHFSLAIKCSTQNYFSHDSEHSWIDFLKIFILIARLFFTVAK